MDSITILIAILVILTITLLCVIILDDQPTFNNDSNVLPSNCDCTENMQDTQQSKIKLFYTNDCGYSRQFLPVWTELQQGDLTKIVSFEEYDCNIANNRATMNDYNVKGYPTLIITTPNGWTEYPSHLPRTRDKIESFVKSLV